MVDESAVTEKPEVTSRTWVVKAEWFWTSVQKEACLIEKEYLLDDVSITCFKKCFTGLEIFAITSYTSYVSYLKITVILSDKKSQISF